MKEQIVKDLKKILATLDINEEINIEHPASPAHGDYSTNIALRVGRGNPMELAERIVDEWEKQGLPSYLAKVEAIKPGFVNLWLQTDALISTDERVPVVGKEKILVEFAHPNTHKQFHLGHLRNIILGESVCRLLEATGRKIVRANYQGDVGPHVAKCLWGLKKISNDEFLISNLKLEEKIKMLGDAYVKGAKVYEEDPTAKKEIEELNQKIYAKDPEVTQLWAETRKWCLEYFDRIYQRLNTKFDRLYFESEVAEIGKQLVLNYLKEGLFESSEGAIIFRGEKYGLHTRVFVNQRGLPTYEAKDLALAELQFEEQQPDKIIHVVGPEQAGYFQVLFKALALVDPKSAGKEFHLSYGWVRLKTGKMSSRTGEVVLGEWLLDEVKKKIIDEFKMDEGTAEKVAVGAVKYSLLRFATKTEMVFDIDESISLDGNSGPYLQYTYSRCNSVLKKAGGRNYDSGIKIQELRLSGEEKDLLRTFYKFPEVVIEAANQYSPNLLANYLFDLAQKYNQFYNQCSILEAKTQESKDFRLYLTAKVAEILNSGLNLLGIETVERM